MNVMKRYFPMVIVSMVTTIATLFAVAAVNYFTNDSFSIAQNEKPQAHFASVDYELRAPENVPDFQYAAEKTVNAVVGIKNLAKNSRMGGGMNPFFDDPFFDHFFFGFPNRQPQRQQDEVIPQGQGSGVIISSDGYIVTNNHVIKGAEKIEVTLNNQKTYTAELIGTDPNTDIALIKIDEKNLPFLSFYNSDNVNVGQWVLAVGNPFGLKSTVTAGIISAKNRSLDLLSKNSKAPIESFLQTDAAINPGNSGGALVNTNGDLIGINTAISSQTGNYVGYGFAVPSNLVKKVVEDIRNFGVVQRGFLGIQALDLSNEEAVKAYNREAKKKVSPGEGVLIQGLEEKGGAIEAGLEEGDIIVKIDGQKIKNFANLSFLIGSRRPGDKVEVTVLRNGKERTYTVTLKDKKGNAKVRSKDDLTVEEMLGATFEPLTERQKIEFGINNGVMLKDVDPSGTLRKLGLSDDFIILKVNDKPVNSANEIEKILKGYKGNVSFEFMDPMGRLGRKGFKMD